MSNAATSRPARRSLNPLAMGCAFTVLALLGMVSLYRQASTPTIDAGFSVTDARGTLAVREGEAADQAGIGSGDRLMSIGGTPVVDPFVWRRALELEPRPGPVLVEVQRGAEQLSFQLQLHERHGPDPIHFYLALVGFFFLATAAAVVFRAAKSSVAWKYCALSVAMFAVFSISDTASSGWLDWVFFFLDRLGRLSVPPLFLLYARSLGRNGLPRRWLTATLWVPPALLGAAGLAVFVSAGRGLLLDPLALWSFKDRIELLVAGIYFVLGLGVLAGVLRRETALYRRYQIRWAFWGSVAGLGPLTVAYLLPAGLGLALPRWGELAALTTVVLPFTLSSVLFRYRPGDLELYFKRAISSLSIVFMTFAAGSAAWVVVERLGRAYLDLSDWISAGIAVLIGAILYPRIRALTHFTIDRLVYGGRYSFRRTLLSFGRDLNSELELDTLVRKFQERIRETLDLTTTLLLVRHDREGELRPVGFAEPVVPVDSPLVERIRGVSYLSIEDLTHAPGAERLDPLNTLGISYLFPMKVKGEVRAVLATGPRRGGEPLASADIELLVALCGHAAVALENARLLAQLRGKVDEVERLRRNNEDILESSRIGILVVDADGVIQALNEALVEIYGASRQAALGRTLGEVFPLPLVRGLENQPEAGLEPHGLRRIYRHVLTDRRGRRIVVNVSRSRLAAGGPGPPGYVITLDDVTDQVRMEEQLLRQDRLASIGLLASGVAHEVNTPLTGISSYAQMLLADLDPSDPRYDVLLKIEKQTFRAANIIHSLLNFTREGSGECETIRVEDLVAESLALFEPQLRAGRIHIEQAIEPGLPLLQGHRGKLQQVLLNLLLNAKDAIGEEGKITVSARSIGGRLLLEVADNGEGIAEEDIGRIFDPFFTTKPRGRGTGLGLSLSYNIVHEHQGEILVESRRGEGTVFTVELPLGSRDRVHA